jgi:hypothetical protein
MRTSFRHQPEAQNPDSSAIHKLAGRLRHLWAAALLTIAIGAPVRTRQHKILWAVQSSAVLPGQFQVERCRVEA